MEERTTAPTRTRATAGGLLAIGLWSTTVAIARSLSEQTGPVHAAAAVYLVSGLISVGFLIHRPAQLRTLRRLPPQYLLGCGGLFVAYMLFLFLAIGRAADRQQVLEVGLLNYLWPVLTVAFSVVLLHRRAHPLLIPGVLLALLGTFLVVMHDAPWTRSGATDRIFSDPTPYGLAFAAAFSCALFGSHSSLGRRAARRGRSTCSAGHRDSAAAAELPGGRAASLDRPRGLEAILLGSAMFAAYRLWDQAMRCGNMLLVAVSSYFTPLFSTVVTCLYLAVMPGKTLWWGCGILILGRCSVGARFRRIAPRERTGERTTGREDRRRT